MSDLRRERLKEVSEMAETAESLAGIPTDKINALLVEGLAKADDDHLRLTLSGWAVADAIVAELI